MFFLKSSLVTTFKTENLKSNAYATGGEGIKLNLGIYSKYFTCLPNLLETYSKNQDATTKTGNAGDSRVATFGAKQVAVKVPHGPYRKSANGLSAELDLDYIHKISQMLLNAGKSKIEFSIPNSDYTYTFDFNEISEAIQKQPQKMVEIFTNFLRNTESTSNNRTINAITNFSSEISEGDSALKNTQDTEPALVLPVDNKKSNSSRALEKASKIAIKKSKRTSKNRPENIEELSSIRVDTSKPLVNGNNATTSEDNSQLKSGDGKQDLQSESLTSNNIAISSLHYAAQMGYTLEVKYLIEQAGADINEKDKYGYTPLHYAAACKYNEETVQFLLNRGAKFDEKNDVGMTPLCFAIVNDCERIVKTLVDRGANVNVVSRSGNTPLHWLVISRHTWDDLCSSMCTHTEIEDFLLNNGANPLLRNNDGQTPEDLAKENENFRQRKDSITSSKGNKQPSSSVSVESEDNKKTGIQFLQEESDDQFQTSTKNKMSLASVPNSAYKPTPSNVGSTEQTTPHDNVRTPTKQVSNTKINGGQLNNPGNESTPTIQSTQKSKWPVVVLTTLAIAGVASGVVIAIYLEMLAVGIAVGACCLVSAAIIYCCSEPSNSLEKSSAEAATNKILFEAPN